MSRNLVDRLRHLGAAGLAAACGIITGCGSTEEGDSAADTPSQVEQGCVQRPSQAQSAAYASFDQPPAGVAGNRDWLFIGSPFEGQVTVIDRVSRKPVGALPTPAQGFVLPYILRLLDSRHLAVLDAGGLPSPSPFVPANPTIYEYELGPSGRAFTAKLTRTVSFASAFIGFAEDIAPIGNGRYVLSDAVLGALWVVDSDGKVRPGVAPKSSNSPGDSFFPLAYCPSMPQITVGGLPFLFSGGTQPGVAALAARNGQVYFYSPCAKGLYTLPITSLFDRRAPHERIADVRLVSAAPPTVKVEQLLGLAFNEFDPFDPYLYAANSLEMSIIRINVRTGRRDTVASDPTLFNFPSSANFIPPRAGAAPLLVVSNQQHRTPLTNDAITAEMFQPPFLATEVTIK